MKPPLLVLCATDLSSDGDLAVATAHRIAGLFGSRLVFVHAVPYPAPSHVLFPHLVQSSTDRLMSFSRVAGETVSKRVASLTGRPAEDIDVRVDVGAPDEVIVEAAEESGADLLILGAQGGEKTGKELGDTVLRVVRHAHCPVLVVREDADQGPILAATDFSDQATDALSIASLMAQKSGDPMVALNVVDSSPVTILPEIYGPGILVPVPESEHQAIRRAASDHLAETLVRLEIKADLLIEDGTPSERIVATADQIDARLVAIGTKGGGGLRRLLLGSVAEDVLRHAPCSVLLVRHHTSGGHE